VIVLSIKTDSNPITACSTNPIEPYWL